MPLQGSEFERRNIKAAGVARELLLGNNTSPRSGLDTAGNIKMMQGDAGGARKSSLFDDGRA